MERLKNFVCRDGFAEVNTNAGRIRGFMEKQNVLKKQNRSAPGRGH